MKKYYLLLIGLALISSNAVLAQFGAIANGDFENWTNQTLYESPTDWKSTNTEEYRGIAVVSKSTTAQEGSYSVMLETAEINGDTLFGYVFHGTTGSNGPDGGIAYTGAFNTVRVQYQSDIVAGDSLYMMMIRFVGGSMVDFAMEKVAGGTVSTWTQVDMTVNTMAQDELFIGFVLGDPNSSERPNPGSWALVDNVQLLNSGVPATDLPNKGFETWATTSVEEPDNWYTLNTMLAGMQLENTNKTIDAYTGSYAVEMTTIQAFGADTIPSFLSLGVIDFNANGSPFVPMPYTATPATFSGAYKYTPVNGDQGAIQINFMQGGSVVGNHFEIFSTAQSTYTTFSAPLTIAATPDSILFLASSGNNPGSVLKLDDLQFTGGDVGIEDYSSNQLIELYPNPASNNVTLNVSENSYSYYIYNVIGKLIESNENVNEMTKLDVSSYSKGAYFVHIKAGNKMFTEKLIIE